MKLVAGLESISEMLGPEGNAGLKVPALDLFSTTLKRATPGHQTYRASSAPGQLPLVVIPAESDLEGFFATVATYYPSHSPLTAYIHILGKELRGCFDPDSLSDVPDRHEVSRPQMARLGACLGETALAISNSGEPELNPSYSSCRRSLAFALARTVALYPRYDATLTVKRWERLRRLTGLTVSRASVQAVCAIHSAATDGAVSLDDGALSQPVQSALVDYVSMPQSGSIVERALLEAYPHLNVTAKEIDGPFDARMAVFLKAVELIHQRTQGVETDSLAVGYLCNRILPGSFAHGKVILRLMEFFPSALVWYGMFCATSSSFDVLQFGSGLFAKLCRDVLQSFSFTQRPQCDLSLDELEVLMRASGRAEVIKPIQQKIASVALLPGIDVLSRFTHGDVGRGEREVGGIDAGMVDERLARVTKLIDEAVVLLHEIGGRGRSAPRSSTSRRQRKR